MNLRGHPARCGRIVLLQGRSKRICSGYDDVKSNYHYSDISIPEASPFGLKGAALAAFGERPLDFDGVVPFTARDEGVKLGESTLRCFFKLDKPL